MKFIFLGDETSNINRVNLNEQTRHVAVTKFLLLVEEHVLFVVFVWKISQFQTSIILFDKIHFSGVHRIHWVHWRQEHRCEFAPVGCPRERIALNKIAPNMEEQNFLQLALNTYHLTDVNRYSTHQHKGCN